MKPADTDVIVEGKRGLCGFASTNLRFILSQNRIENVVLAGFLVSHDAARV
jgi:nicotinamidase-related amidase